MGFKLGSKPYPVASGGSVTSKFGFKVKKGVDLEDGVLGEAHPGEIHISKEVEEGSALERRVLSHEGQHVKDIASGRAAFGDDWVRWEGKTYPRKDGKIKYNGTWSDEGSERFPWEKSAMKAEK